MVAVIKFKQTIPLLGMEYAEWFKSQTGRYPKYIPTRFNDEGKRMWRVLYPSDLKETEE